MGCTVALGLRLQEAGKLCLGWTDKGLASDLSNNKCVKSDATKYVGLDEERKEYFEGQVGQLKACSERSGLTQNRVKRLQGSDLRCSTASAVMATVATPPR